MRTLPLLFLLVLVCVSCGSDDNIVGNASIVDGRWELERATRNNVETPLLDGLHFQFREDGTLSTNLMGNTTDGTYRWDGDEIQTEGVSIPMTYTVRELTDSTLHLRSQYQGFQFGFELVRR